MRYRALLACRKYVIQPQHPQFALFLVAPLLLPPAPESSSAARLGLSLMAPGAPLNEPGIEKDVDSIRLTPLRATSMNASSTLCPSLAEVSKNEMLLWERAHSYPSYVDTWRSPSLSSLFPRRRNGKFLTSSGPAFSTKPSLHFWRASKLLRFVIS